MRIACYILTVGILFFNALSAQTIEGQHELSVSAGYLSGRTVNDKLTGEKAGKETMATPSYFASYRYYVRDKVSIGGTFGTQTIQGKSGSQYIYNPYTYTFVNTTAAAEITYAYKDMRHYQLYTLFGTGISHFTERDFFSAPGSVAFSGNAFNFQYTPVAIRFGGKVAGFVELGVGYKGVINGGLSYKFNSGKLRRTQALLKQISYDEIIILPHGFPLDKDLKPLGMVRTGNPGSTRAGNFKEQMAKISVNVNRVHGNVFQVSYISDEKLHNVYNIVGDAYSAGGFAEYKAKVKVQKNLRFENGTCAYLVIYSPDYKGRAGNTIKVNIEGTTPLDLKKNMRYIIKVAKEGSYRISLGDGSHVIPVDIKFGNNYYIKAFRKGSFCGLSGCRSFIGKVDDLQGELESSIINNAHVTDLKAP